MCNRSSIGVGVMFNPSLAQFVESCSDAVDFFSIVPERFWNDFGRGSSERFVPLPNELAQLDRIVAKKPIVAHGIGLSIASASLFDLDYIHQLKDWQARFGFAWISEHLAAVRVAQATDRDHHAGLALPLAWDVELLDLLCERIRQAQDVLGQPMLFENGVEYTPVPFSEMSEPAFLNALVERTGCGVLLDLHNLHVNAKNLGHSAQEFVDALNLDAVVEMHIAGGSTMNGVYLDSHSGPCPTEVLELLTYAAPRCPNLRGVTFEFLESFFPLMGDDGVLAQIAQARQALQPLASPVPCPSPNSSVHLAT